MFHLSTTDRDPQNVNVYGNLSQEKYKWMAACQENVPIDEQKLVQLQWVP